MTICIKKEFCIPIFSCSNNLCCTRTSKQSSICQALKFCPCSVIISYMKVHNYAGKPSWTSTCFKKFCRNEHFKVIPFLYINSKKFTITSVISKADASVQDKCVCCTDHLQLGAFWRSGLPQLPVAWNFSFSWYPEIKPPCQASLTLVKARSLRFEVTCGRDITCSTNKLIVVFMNNQVSNFNWDIAPAVLFPMISCNQLHDQRYDGTCRCQLTGTAIK